MGISLLGASTGITTSDLITVPDWVEVASYTSTSATTKIDIQNIPTTYKKLKIISYGTQFNNTADKISFRVNNNSGTIYSCGHKVLYNSAGVYMITGFNEELQDSFAMIRQANIPLGRNIQFIFEIERYGSTSGQKIVSGETLYYDTNGRWGSDKFDGLINTTSPVTEINFISYNGNLTNLKTGIVNGGIYVYGAK